MIVATGGGVYVSDFDVYFWVLLFCYFLFHLNLVMLFFIGLNGKGFSFVRNIIYLLKMYHCVFQISDKVASSLIRFPEISVQMKLIMKKKFIRISHMPRIIPVTIPTTIRINASTLSPMFYLRGFSIKGFWRTIDD